MTTSISVFTFPRRKYKNYNKKQLEKMCNYHNIPTTFYKVGMYTNLENFEQLNRIKINDYYLPTQFHYTNFTKTYEDKYRKVFILNSMVIRYDKEKYIWDFGGNTIKVSFIPILVYWNNIIDYFELFEVYKTLTQLYTKGILIPDIIYHTIKIHNITPFKVTIY